MSSPIDSSTTCALHDDSPYLKPPHSLLGFDLKLTTENLSCSACEKEEICLSASVLTASLKGRTVRTLPPSIGLVLVPS
ncbi:hypothetical protein BDN67DRAFT_1018052 [Paxillus ammoniavirescens]|nr:hypothetical protein BDN67DRAFT_1018052 [Paxillus ammoniavirescens]